MDRLTHCKEAYRGMQVALEDGKVLIPLDDYNRMLIGGVRATDYIKALENEVWRLENEVKLLRRAADYDVKSETGGEG